jgi:HlyD family secretion protein
MTLAHTISRPIEVLMPAKTPAPSGQPGEAAMTAPAKSGRRPPTNKVLAAAIALVAVAAAVAWYLFRPQGLPEGFASGNGRIEATEVDVAAKIPGRLKEIHVREGDFVRPDQVVAQMDVATLEAQHSEYVAKHKQALDAVATADARVAMARADAAAAEAVVAQREAELDAARRRLACGRSHPERREGGGGGRAGGDRGR